MYSFFVRAEIIYVKEKKQNGIIGEVYFLRYVVWMYLLLPPCIIMFKDRFNTNLCA